MNSREKHAIFNLNIITFTIEFFIGVFAGRFITPYRPVIVALPHFI
jgi:hypothetical protein